MANAVATVGTGLVGRAWGIVFARAGFAVRLYDPVEGAVENALALIEAALPDLAEAGLLNNETSEAVRARLRPAASLEEALDGVVHVQESAPERLPVKQALWPELDRAAPAGAVLASSTSGIPASRFTEGLEGRHRCLVAHPINPPHMVPLVEIIPAPWTDTDTVARTRALMTQVRQSPITLNREVNGFVVNRLQGALLSEAFRLVQDGVCGVADVDAAIKDGLGLRWSFMGPFETIDLNAPAGVREYCDNLGPLYYELAREQADPRPWDEDLIDEVERQRRALLPADGLPARAAWRDRRLARLMLARHRADEELGK